MDYKGALAPPARPSQPPITPPLTTLSLELICTVGVMQHKAKGSVLHPRNIDKLQGQRNTCGARMTCYCNIKRLPGGKRGCF
ncbi:hypothetical protein PSHT_00710 [Puccinia striiformis]|uniref:Uncharacterized protein n=1 Tax=Puccinia striiformis TaxID=27350 RepID=A0A2S4WMJ1_9BASI|nr:hypothetical protein PSHT_00710 [Puccinia striiformis]